MPIYCREKEDNFSWHIDVKNLDTKIKGLSYASLKPIQAVFLKVN